MMNVAYGVREGWVLDRNYGVKDLWHYMPDVQLLHSIALCQSTSPDSTTSPAQYFWSSGLLCRRSDGLEFTTG